ncbi:hypothetical protein SUDANB91_00068 [Streptomyces sp. SudanB91_2054]
MPPEKVAETGSKARLPAWARSRADGGAEALLGDRAAWQGVRGQEVVLSDDLVQLGGAQAVGEWTAGSSSKSGRAGSMGLSVGGELCTGVSAQLLVGALGVLIGGGSVVAAAR